MDKYESNLTIMDEKGYYTYKKLSPSSNGTYEEENISVTNTSRFNALFPFISGRRLHIFCIYLDDIPIDKIVNNSTYLYVNELWKEELSERKEAKRQNGIISITNCEPNIPICESTQSFIDLFSIDMLQNQCISKHEFTEFRNFLLNPCDEKAAIFFQNPQNSDITLIYMISRDTYESLKKCYCLPRRNSAVIKITENIIVKRGEFDSLNQKAQAYEKLKDLLIPFISSQIIKNNEQFNLNIDSIFSESIKELIQNELRVQYKTEEKPPLKDENR